MGCKFLQTRRSALNKKNHDRKAGGALRKLRRDKFNHDKIKFAGWNKRLKCCKIEAHNN